MDLTVSILKDIRESVVGVEDNTEFDGDLIPYINSAISTLNQVGVGHFIFVKNEDQTWGDFMDDTQIEGNQYFQMANLYISLSTKLLFDPPPPSNVQYHSNRIEELLWRLKTAYEVREELKKYGRV